MLRPYGTAYFTPGVQPVHASNQGYNVPIDLVIVNSATQKVGYSEPEFRNIVESANKVWQKANVTFVVRSIDYKEVPDEVLNDLDSFDNAALKQFGKALVVGRFEDGIIDVIFLKSFSKGVEDVAIVEGKVSIAFLTGLENIDFMSWTLAHELGHTLGLRDVFEFDNLIMRVGQ